MMLILTHERFLTDVFHGNIVQVETNKNLTSDIRNEVLPLIVLGGGLAGLT